MLKTIHPLLSADLLSALRAMGHGDELVICDRNFPAASIAAATPFGRPIPLDGVGAIDAAEAILTLLPLDSFVDHCALRMEVVGEPDTMLEIHDEFQRVLNRSAGRSLALGSVERFAFYQRARRAFAVVATGETRGYGCFILVKGVIGADGETVW